MSIRGREHAHIGLVVTTLLSVGVLASGCHFWRTFTAYFNTLYLAQQHLEIYEEQMRTQPQTQNESQAQAVTAHRWIDEEYEMRQIAMRTGTAPKIQASFMRTKVTVHGVTTNVHLDSAIILGSKILANKKDTKYVEDALFIVGKAQFYKNDFAGAKRKFLELQSLYPDSKYGSAVQMFLARAMLAANQFDTAQLALSIAVKKAEQEHDDHSLGDAHRTLAEIIYMRSPDSLSAIATELEAAEKYYTGNEAAQLAYEAGIVEYLGSDWSRSIASFTRAASTTGDASLEGESRLNRALVERAMGKFGDAKADLLIVSEKSRFSSSTAAAKYELAYTADLEARAQVKNDLRSREFITTDYPALRQAYYIVDTTYRSQSQLIASRVHFREAELFRGMGEFDSASHLATPLINTKEFSSSDMNKYVSDRMRSLSHFSQWRNDLAHLDSLDHEIKLAREGIDVNQAQIAVLHSAAVKEVLGAKWRPDAQIELTKEEQAAVVKIEAKLRKEQGILGAFERLGVKDTVRFADSVHLRMANDHYELGLAYENFDDAPTARNEYQLALGYHMVLSDTAIDEFRARVLYTWLQLEHNEKRFAVRDSLMRELLQAYSQSIYARQAITFFGGPRDPNSPAERAYREAYATLRSNGVEPAKPQFMAVVDGFRQDDVAPRSLFAVGVSYEELSKYDSAVVYYREVLTSYPYSPYADALRPRLANVVKTTTQQTARRVTLTTPQTDEERQQQTVEQAKRQRQQELFEQMKRQSMPQSTPSSNDTTGAHPSTNSPNSDDNIPTSNPNVEAPPMFESGRKH